MAVMERSSAWVIGLLVMQVAVWSQTNQYLPRLGLLDQVPSSAEAKLSSIGDDQLYFRIAAIQLQNAGDSFGRFTALRDYNYELLRDWMMFMDDFDSQSNFLPAISSYYYSNTQRPADNQYIIEYLEKRYDQSPVENWWWLAQAVHLALNKMEDRPLALRLAYKLAATPHEKMPRWAQQMPIFVLEKMGEREQALAIVKDLANKYNNYSQGEINFMNYFIQERLGYLKEEIKKKPKYATDDIFAAPYMDE